MSNSYRYFENRDCKYYPCHQGLDEINCLFCYCPLYAMSNCPGSYRMIESHGRQIKSCMDCTFPHIRENYDKVNAIIKKNNEAGCGSIKSGGEHVDMLK